MSATDEPMALSTRLWLTAAVSGAIGYLHGLLGAVLAEQHIQHLGSWASGVSAYFGFGALALAAFGCMTLSAEHEMAKSRLHAEDVERWERANRAELAEETLKQTLVAPCDEAVAVASAAHTDNQPEHV